MSKRKKGLSADEKRSVMLQIFHSTQSVYNLKELESLGSKAGVVLQTVEETVKSLMYDGLIEQDKIGSGNFFWSFPAKAYIASKAKLDDLESQIAKDKATIEQLQEKIKLAQAQQGDDAAAARREAKMQKLEHLKSEKVAIDKLLAAHSDNDPEVVAALEQKCKKAKLAAERWTDNCWAVKSYVVSANSIGCVCASACLVLFLRRSQWQSQAPVVECPVHQPSTHQLPLLRWLTSAAGCRLPGPRCMQVNKFNMDPKEVATMLKMGDDFDYPA